MIVFDPGWPADVLGQLQEIVAKVLSFLQTPLSRIILTRCNGVISGKNERWSIDCKKSKIVVKPREIAKRLKAKTSPRNSKNLIKFLDGSRFRLRVHPFHVFSKQPSERTHDVSRHA